MAASAAITERTIWNMDLESPGWGRRRRVYWPSLRAPRPRGAGKLEERPRIRTSTAHPPRRALTLGPRTPNSRLSDRGARLSRCIVVIPTYNEAENLPL